MTEPIVFTKIYKNSTFDGFLITDEHINYNDRSIPIKALWDTGSSESVISSNLVKELSLKSVGSALLNGTNLSHKTNVYEIILLLARKQKIALQVIESSQISNSGIDFLIGLDVITMCDFSLSTYNEDICLSVRYPSKGFIDFTKQ